MGYITIGINGNATRKILTFPGHNYWFAPRSHSCAAFDSAELIDN